MKRWHKPLALALCLVLCAGLLPAAAPAAACDGAAAETLAGGLNALGLFRNTGIDGTDGDALDRPLTRAEALVMLVRLLGREPEAVSGSWTHPFTDVADWAAPYVGYAYQAGLTNGISATLFGSDEPADCAMYLTYVLRALRYQDCRNSLDADRYDQLCDFIWNEPFALATYCHILPLSVDSGAFLRRDAVQVSYAALTATLKGTEQTLAEALIEEGAFTREQYDGAVDETVFSDSRAIDAALSAAVLAHEAPEAPGDYDFSTESHRVLALSENGETLDVSAMICCQSTENNRFGERLSVLERIVPAYLTLRKLPDGSYETLSYRTFDPSGGNTDAAALFSPSTLAAIEQYDGKELLAVCRLKSAAYLASGALVFETKTSADAVAELVNAPYTTVEAQLTAPDYGVILCRLVPAGMHGLTPSLCLVTNDKSPLGEARVIYFPLPSATFYLLAEPEQLALNESGDALTYQVTFLDDLIIPMGDGESSQAVHRKGTYYYSADLATGEVTETFTAAP